MIDFDKDVMPLKNKFYRLALRLLHDDAEAQDVTQETLIRLWTRCGALASAADAEKLGFTISYNLSRDSLARAGRNYEQLEDIDENSVEDTSQSAVDTLAAADRHNMLREMMGRLPVRQKTVMQLRDIEGKSYREIAAVLQLSDEQVKVTLFRARQYLKSLYQKKQDNGL